MADSHLQDPLTPAVPMDLIQGSRDIPLSELEGFWNKEQPQSDLLAQQHPAPQTLQSTLIHDEAFAPPEFPNLSVISTHVSTPRPGMAYRATLGVNKPGFIRESPIKIFERMKANRDLVQKSPQRNVPHGDNFNWDLMLIQNSNICSLNTSQGVARFHKNIYSPGMMSSDDKNNPNGSPLVGGPDACPRPRNMCRHPAVCKPSPLKVFLSMKADAARRMHIGKEDAENAVSEKDQSAPSSQPDVCSRMVIRSGRTIKPVLKYWCGERLVMNNDLDVKIEKGRENQLCFGAVKENLQSTHYSEPRNVSMVSAREKSEIKPPSDSVEYASSENDIEKRKRNLPQVRVTPLSKAKLKAKCKSHNQHYESKELSYQQSGSISASDSQAPSPSGNLQDLRKTARVGGKRQPISLEESISSLSSEEESMSDPGCLGGKRQPISFLSSEEPLQHTEANPKRSHEKSENQINMETRCFQKTGHPRRMPRARGTQDNHSSLDDEDFAPFEKKPGHANMDSGRSAAVGESSNSRRTAYGNMVSPVDSNDSDNFYGRRPATRSGYSSREEPLGLSWHRGDKWTEKEVQHPDKATAVLGKSENWSWEDAALKVQTRSAGVSQKKYTLHGTKGQARQKNNPRKRQTLNKTQKAGPFHGTPEEPPPHPGMIV